MLLQVLRLLPVPELQHEEESQVSLGKRKRAEPAGPDDLTREHMQVCVMLIHLQGAHSLWKVVSEVVQ